MRIDKSKGIIKILKSKRFVIWAIIIILFFLLFVIYTQVIINQVIINDKNKACKQDCISRGGLFMTSCSYCNLDPGPGCKINNGYESCSTLNGKKACKSFCEASGGEYIPVEECAPNGLQPSGKYPTGACSCPYDGDIKCENLFWIGGCKNSDIGEQMELCARTGGFFSCFPGRPCIENPTCTYQKNKLFSQENDKKLWDCMSFESFSMTGKCFGNIAAEREDLSICELGVFGFYCYARFAELKNSPESCMYAGESFQRCYYELAIAKNDSSFCNKIIDAEWRDSCYAETNKVESD